MLRCLHHGWPFVDVLFHNTSPDYQGPKLKTMQGVEHDINKICKMSRPMSKGILGGLPLGPSQYSLSWDSGRRLFYYKPQAQAHSFHGLKPKLTPFMASSPSSLLSWSQVQAHSFHGLKPQAHSFHGLFRIV
jgi:hypothetical protein